jgi:hypothetical protein
LTTVHNLNPSLDSRAEIVKVKFHVLLLAFSKCHNIYNAGRKIDDNEIQALGEKCNFYFAKLKQF